MKADAVCLPVLQQQHVRLRRFVHWLYLSAELPRRFSHRPKRTLSAFKRQLKTHSSVPALDSAGCSCGCRVPSYGAVVAVYREFGAVYSVPGLDSARAE